MKKKILIVDDERSIVRLLSLRLRSQNYDVIGAYDGYQCVEIAKSEIPDLILLDIKMPNGGGIKAFEKLQSLDETKHIPVIFITAYPKPEIKELVLKMGAAGFITKPFDGELLNERIKYVLKPNPKEKTALAQKKDKLNQLSDEKNRFSLDYN